MKKAPDIPEPSVVSLFLTLALSSSSYKSMLSDPFFNMTTSCKKLLYIA